MQRAAALLLGICAGACHHPPRGDDTAPLDGAPAADAAPPAGSSRATIELPTWRFHRGAIDGAQAPGFDDAAWSEVTLPHTWNAVDGQQGGNAYYRGVGWYRRHVTVDPAHAGRRLFLELDGANLVAEVFVDGASLGVHRGGYARFRFDVTDAVGVGRDAVVAVKVDNAYHVDIAPLDADFSFFGGLYRPVRLVVTDPVHVTLLDHGSPGVYVRTDRVSAASADVQVTAVVRNDGDAAATVTVTARILDATGTEVQAMSSEQAVAAGADARLVGTATLAAPHLWDGRRDPYLYAVRVETRVGDALTDVVTEPLGVRAFAIDPARGFSLNGQPLDLHGVNKHQDRLDLGWAIGDAQQDEDIALIEELGATAVRAAHYQHAQRFYDLADRRGLIVWAEIPVVNRITASPAFRDGARDQMVELIRQNYNHPSIVFWSISNEVTLQPGPDPRALQDMLGQVVRDEDPTRLSAVASTGSESDLGHTQVVGYNKYFGWYTGSYGDFAGWADAQHATLPAVPIAVTEYGAGASIAFHTDAPRAQDHTEEYQALFHEAHWRAMKTRPFLWGKFVWNMFDFAASARDEGDTPGRNDKGLVTYDRRTRKDAFYFYKANWTSEPFVYITSRRFATRTRAATLIKVYGTVDSVEVRLNGRSLGSRTPTDGIYVWSSVTLAPGENQVEAIGRRGDTTVSDRVTWTLSR